MKTKKLFSEEQFNAYNRLKKVEEKWSASFDEIARCNHFNNELDDVDELVTNVNKELEESGLPFMTFPEKYHNKWSDKELYIEDMDFLMLSDDIEWPESGTDEWDAFYDDMHSRISKDMGDIWFIIRKHIDKIEKEYDTFRCDETYEEYVRTYESINQPMIEDKIRQKIAMLRMEKSMGALSDYDREELKRLEELEDDIAQGINVTLDDIYGKR